MNREKLKKLLITIRDIIIRTYTEFQNDHCTARAGSLSYSTLMAIVPLSAFVVALLTAFGSFEDVILEIQTFVVGILVPTRQDEFIHLLDEFIGNSQALGTVGFLLFAVTSINLIDNINMNINVIWGIRPGGNILGKFTTYTAALLFGTLLIAVSFTGRPLLSSIIPPGVSALWSFVVAFVPTFFMFAAIFLLIGVVPRVKIGPRYAASGAFVAVIFWELARKGFVEGSSYVLRASVMYGSLALIPIFLFWLYIIWIIIMGAAELTYCLQFRSKPWSVHSFKDLDPAQRFSLGLQIFLTVSSAFRRGDHPPTKKELSDKFGIAIDDINSFSEIFQESELMYTVGKDEWSMLPGRPLESITLKEIFRCLAGTTTESPETSVYFKKVWKDINVQIDELNDISVDDYLINEIVDEV